MASYNAEQVVLVFIDLMFPFLQVGGGRGRIFLCHECCFNVALCMEYGALSKYYKICIGSHPLTPAPTVAVVAGIFSLSLLLLLVEGRATGRCYMNSRERSKLSVWQEGPLCLRPGGKLCYLCSGKEPAWSLCLHSKERAELVMLPTW